MLIDSRRISHNTSVKILWFTSILFSGYSLQAQLSVPPKAALDPVEAKELLKPGSSSIKGVAYTN